MPKLKIATVCGFGVGSSLILKMQLDGVLQELGVDAEITPCDITSILGERCDMIFTSGEFLEQLRSQSTAAVYAVEDFLNRPALLATVTKALADFNTNK